MNELTNLCQIHKFPVFKIKIMCVYIIFPDGKCERRSGIKINSNTRSSNQTHNFIVSGLTLRFKLLLFLLLFIPNVLYMVFAQLLPTSAFEKRLRPRS